MTSRPSPLRRHLQARLGLGRSPTDSPDEWVIALPGVVLTLLGAMAAMFALGFVLPNQVARRLDYALGFVPGRLEAVFEDRYRTSFIEGAGPLLTHVFIHGNFAHLALNAVGLAIFGTAVARRFHADAPGQARWRNTGVYLSFFFLSGVAGALLYAVVNNGSGVNLVGASGAISGLMAGALLFALRPFAPYGPGEGPLVSARSKPVLVTTIVYIGMNLATAIGLGTFFGVAANVAWEAHIGGYLFGLFSFPVFDRMTRRASEVAR